MPKTVEKISNIKFKEDDIVYFPNESVDSVTVGKVMGVTISCLGIFYEVEVSVTHRKRGITIKRIVEKKENELFRYESEAFAAKAEELKSKLKNVQEQIDKVCLLKRHAEEKEKERK